MSTERIPRRRLLAGMGSAGITTLAGCLDVEDSPYSPGQKTDTEWPMPAYDRRYSGFNPEAAAPREGVTERWSREIDWPLGRPVVAAGTVLVPTYSGLYAFDSATGNERWHVGSDQVYHSPVIHDGTVYIPFPGPSLRALDIRDGSERWRVPMNDKISAAVTFNHEWEDLFVGDRSGRIYQINPASGKVKRTGNVFGEVTAFVYDPTGLLVVGTSSGEVYQVGSGESKLQAIWRRKVGGAVRAIASVNKEPYVATFDGPLYRLSGGMRTGSTRWKYERADMKHLAVTDNDVVGMGHSSVQVVDAFTGTEKWSQKKDNTPYDSAPAIAGDTLYVGMDDGIEAYALDGGTTIATLRFEFGEQRWSFSTKSPPTKGLAVADGAVFAVTKGRTKKHQHRSSRMYALDPA